MPTDIFQSLARNNAWSNHRLLLSCETLTEAEFKAVRTSFFPSLWETLNHILDVDLYYLDCLTGGGLGYAIFDRYVPSDTAAALRPLQAASDRRLIAFCEGLAEDDTGAEVVTLRGERGAFPERIDALLMHLFTHQTHHRGQAHAMLAGTSVSPPQLDEFFLRFDAPARQAEIDGLGFRR